CEQRCQADHPQMFKGEIGDFEFVLNDKLPQIHARPRWGESGSHDVPNASAYFATRGSDDFKNSSGELREARRPSSSNAILDARSIASRRSCVTNRTVLPNCLCSDKNSR